MKLFRCQNCGNTVLFENAKCVQCGLMLGFLPDALEMSAVERQGANWRTLGSEQRECRFCANWELDSCNWLVADPGETIYCRACLHNRMIPNLSDPVNQSRWSKLEHAKKRLIYSLLRLRMPLPTPNSADREPLMFDFLGDTAPDGGAVKTGHDNGLITLAISEADDAAREKTRTLLREPYRTLLGHFRHESGHYYWDRLVRDVGKLDAYREIFGDERIDYGPALQKYYAQGAPPDWNDHFVSEYAASHPWEDFAETFAHYLHIVDTLDTALSVGIRISNRQAGHVRVAFDPYEPNEISQLVEVWIAVSFAANCLNRSMGQPDLYPFVLSPMAVNKLEFVNSIIHSATRDPCLHGFRDRAP
ncbi:MAG TPA: putative zinc-binding metallopeptidase [Methylocella sp.]